MRVALRAQNNDEANTIYKNGIIGNNYTSRIGSRAIEHLRGNARIESYDICRTQQPRLAQRQIIRVIATQGNFDDAFPAACRRSGQPIRNGVSCFGTQRVERATRGQRSVQRTATLARFGEARAQCIACAFQPSRQPAERRREDLLQPQTQLLGQPRRSAAGADRDQHGRPVEDRGHREVAQGRSVGHIDQQPGLSGALGVGVGSSFVIFGDEGQPGTAGNAKAQIVDHHAAGPLDQSPLRLGSVTLPQHHDGMASDAMEQG